MRLVPMSSWFLVVGAVLAAQTHCTCSPAPLQDVVHNSRGETRPAVSQSEEQAATHFQHDVLEEVSSTCLPSASVLDAQRSIEYTGVLAEGDALSRVAEYAKAAAAYRQATRIAQTPEEVEEALRRLLTLDQPGIYVQIVDVLRATLVMASPLGVLAMVLLAAWFAGFFQRRPSQIAIHSAHSELSSTQLEALFKLVLHEMNAQPDLIRNISSEGSCAIASPTPNGMKDLSVRGIDELNVGDLELPTWSSWPGFLSWFQSLYQRAKAGQVLRIALLNTGGSLVVLLEPRRTSSGQRLFARKSSDAELSGAICGLIYEYILTMRWENEGSDGRPK